MLTTQFSGGLGNVLFQLFASISLAYKHRMLYNFHGTDLGRFVGTVLNPAVLGIAGDVSPEMTINEQDIASLSTHCKKHVQLQGTFQHYSYFHEYAVPIAHQIGLLQRRQEARVKFQEFLFGERFPHHPVVVSMHIRRGDYVPNRCYHLLLNEHYYRNALVNLVGRLPSNRNVRVLVFFEKSAREDVDKIIETLKDMVGPMDWRSRVEFVYFLDEVVSRGIEVQDFEEIMAMSLCEHHIVGNSTFSWWGAYLGTIFEETPKIVCVPDEFYNHQLFYLNVKGFFVPGWTVVSAWHLQHYKCRCFFLVGRGYSTEQIWYGHVRPEDNELWERICAPRAHPISDHKVVLGETCGF
jgi:hypothetical protein